MEFRLSAKRDVAAAKAFFRMAIKGQECAPRTITLDDCAAWHHGVHKMNADDWLSHDMKLRLSKCLNSAIEQQHRGVRLRLGPTFGFKRFNTAAIMIGGFKPLCRIHKGQFALRRLGLKDKSRPAAWKAVIAADSHAAVEGYRSLQRICATTSRVAPGVRHP